MMGVSVLGILSFGCSEKDTHPTDTHTTKAALYQNIQLREGVSIIHEDNTGTGLTCMNGNLELTLPEVRPSLTALDQQDEFQNNTVWHRAFWVNKADDVQTVIQQSTEASNGMGMLDFDHFGKVVKRHYENVFKNSNEPVVTMLVVIPTADHFVKPKFNGPCVTVPPSDNALDPQPSDLKDWIHTCGARYLEEVKYGHYFLMSASLDNLTNAFQSEAEKGWNILTQELQLEAMQNQTGTAVALDTLAQRYPDIEFLVTASHEFSGGVNYPVFAQPYMNISDFDAFVDHYTQIAIQAVSTQDFSALGVPVWQYTPVYHPNSYLQEVCGLQMTDLDVAFGCFYEFEEADRAMTHRLLPQLSVYFDALQNPSLYAQPNDSADWQNFINTILTPLQQALPTLRTNCNDALSSGDANIICGACDETPIQEVLEAFGSLTRPQRAIPTTNPNFKVSGLYNYILNNNQTQLLGPIADKFCTYSWVGGKLEGTGEGTTLERSGNDWVAQTFSQQTADSTRLRAEITCTVSIVRKGNCGGTYCRWSESCVANTCQTSQEYMDTTATFFDSVNNGQSTLYMLPPNGYPTTPYLTTFAGMSGKTRGLAEEVLTVNNVAPNPPQLKVRSQQGIMKGWATGFRITDATSHNFAKIDTDPYTANPYEVTLSNASASINQPVEFTLAPENQAYCYLTSVGGYFAGAGENVKLLRKSGSWVLHVRAAGKHECPSGGWAATGCPLSQRQLRTRARCVEYFQ